MQRWIAITWPIGILVQVVFGDCPGDLWGDYGWRGEYKEEEIGIK